MAHTDKTDPYRVNLADGTYKAQAHHECHGTVCDLPATPAEQFRRHGYRIVGCYWDLAFTGTNVCGCAMCTDRLARKQGRRRSRHQAKEAIRAGRDA